MLYIVSWKVHNDHTKGHHSGKIDEAEKERLVASLEADATVYDIEVMEA